MCIKERRERERGERENECVYKREERGREWRERDRERGERERVCVCEREERDINRGRLDRYIDRESENEIETDRMRV